MKATPKLPLTAIEKANLRKSKVPIRELYLYREDELVTILACSLKRAKILCGLAEFQCVPSIGLKLAEKLVYHLHIYSLNEIKDCNGAELLDKLELTLGVWTDSCVEDQIRCVIHYANNPTSTKSWFDFTQERKRYREKEGYPANRPKTAWNKNRQVPVTDNVRQS